MKDNIHDDLIFVGYTNGYQILYAASSDYSGEGVFYKTDNSDCIIPLYMLKTHQHRIESTTNMNVTADDVSKAIKKGE